MNATNMDYNTQQEHLVLPEYGRNIQRMVNFACTVEDRDERNKIAHAIIAVMGQLNPHLRDVADFKHKLWDHILIISDFKLDVDSPYPKPSKESFISKPDLLKYPGGGIKYKHYGKVTEDIIKKAKDYKEGAEKTYLIEVIANLLKRQYLNWNRDSVNDEVILKHLVELSDGELKLEDVSKLSSTHDLLPRTPNSSNNNSRNNGGKKNFRQDNNGGRNHKHHGKFKRNNNNRGEQR